MTIDRLKKPRPKSDMNCSSLRDLAQMGFPLFKTIPEGRPSFGELPPQVSPTMVLLDNATEVSPLRSPFLTA